MATAHQPGSVPSSPPLAWPCCTLLVEAPEAWISIRALATEIGLSPLAASRPKLGRK